jgi:SagB-type dehydrogenase family enzyme
MATASDNKDINDGRKFLKSDRWAEWRAGENDQKKGVLPPPLQKPVPVGAKTIDLPSPTKLSFGQDALIDVINRRRSHRKYTEEFLSLEELSFLLWATQGVKEIVKDGEATRRTVPSGGARHPFETYLGVDRVKSLAPGLYRYLPVEHKLLLVDGGPDVYSKIDEGTNKQNRGAAVVFVWTAIPHRTEWRYSFLSAKLIALDAGHLCQNLYLAATAIGAGTCALDAYDQHKLDEALGVDGEDEFAIYCAPVGKVPVDY